MQRRVGKGLSPPAQPHSGNTVRHQEGKGQGKKTKIKGAVTKSCLLSTACFTAQEVIHTTFSASLHGSPCSISAFPCLANALPRKSSATSVTAGATLLSAPNGLPTREQLTCWVTQNVLVGYTSHPHPPVTTGPAVPLSPRPYSLPPSPC